MLRWYPSVLLQVLLEMTLLPIAFFSVFAVNAIFDRNTPWVIGGLSGPGMSSDFWVVLFLLAVGWFLIILGWRGAKLTFKCLIVFWHLGLTVVSVFLIWDPGNLILRGEAIGFSMSFEVLGPLFALASLIIAVIWVINDLLHGTRDRSVSPLQRRNRFSFCIALICLVLSGFAFSFDYEQFGTIAGLVAVLAMHEAIRPVNPSKELHKALVTEGSAPR